MGIGMLEGLRIETKEEEYWARMRKCRWCLTVVHRMELTTAGLCPECARKSREQDRKLLANNPKLVVRFGYRRDYETNR